MIILHSLMIFLCLSFLCASMHLCTLCYCLVHGSTYRHVCICTCPVSSHPFNYFLTYSTIFQLSGFNLHCSTSQMSRSEGIPLLALHSSTLHAASSNSSRPFNTSSWPLTKSFCCSLSSDRVNCDISLVQFY